MNKMERIERELNENDENDMNIDRKKDYVILELRNAKKITTIH